MRTVTVTGQGTSREVPDTVVARVAASHRAAGVAEALAGAGSAADEIVAVAKEHTDERRIQSTSLTLWPAYDDQGAATYAPADRRELVDVRSYDTFRQVAWAGSFEGSTTLGLGVRGRLPVRAFTLTGADGSSRLVVDVAHRW